MFNKGEKEFMPAIRIRSLSRLPLVLSMLFVCTVWLVPSPSGANPDAKEETMIEERLPPGRTIKDASKAEFLFAVCDTVRGDARGNAAAIAGVAVYAHREYAGDIVEAIIRCAFLGREPDCDLTIAIVAAAVAADPEGASGIERNALSLAPNCASAIRATTDFAKDAMRNQSAPLERKGGVTPSQSAPKESVAGQGGGPNRKEPQITVCDNGTERTIPQSQAKDFISKHPGSVMGSCAEAVGAAGQEDIADSTKPTSPAPPKGSLSESGKEVLPATGKEVLSGSGKEVLLGSGKEILPTSGKEFLPGPSNPASTFRVSVSVREGYDDNVYTTRTNRVDSFFTKASASLDFNFADAQTQFNLQAIGGLAYYYDHPFGGEYDVNSSLTLSVSHRATPDLTLSGSAYLSYQSEPDFNYAMGINQRAGNFFYTADGFSVAYQWTRRFSTSTSYSLGAIRYDDSAIGDFENRFQHTFGNEFRFLVYPNTTLVGEYRYQIIDFETLPHDSTTNFVLAGLDHNFNSQFNVSLRGGAEFRQIDNFGERSSPYVEANVSYAVEHGVSLSWISRYGLEEPDGTFSPSRETFRTGLNLSCSLLPRLTSTLALFYQHDDNDGLTTPALIVPAFTEESLDIELGVRYEINRILALLVGYSHTEVFSDIASRDYSRNRYYLGLNATF